MSGRLDEAQGPTDRVAAAVEQPSENPEESVVDKKDLEGDYAGQHVLPLKYEGSSVSSLEEELRPVILSELRLVEPVLASVAGCSMRLQATVQKSELHLRACLRVAADYMMLVDPQRRLTVYYVLHDLIQREPDARIPFLTIVFTRLVPFLPGDSQHQIEPYRKTIEVWRDRRVFTPEVCDAALALLQNTASLDRVAKQFEERLVAFQQHCTRRAHCDYLLERCLSDGPDSTPSATGVSPSASIATKIITADAAELNTMHNAAREALNATETVIKSASCFLLNFEGVWRNTALSRMHNVMMVLDRCESFGGDDASLRPPPKSVVDM